MPISIAEWLCFGLLSDGSGFESRSGIKLYVRYKISISILPRNSFCSELIHQEEIIFPHLFLFLPNL